MQVSDRKLFHFFNAVICASMAISLLRASDSSPIASFLTHYLTLLLAVISLFSVQQLRKPTRTSDTILAAGDFWALVTCVGLSFALYLYHVHDVSIWLDESVEGGAVLSFKDLLSRHASHQQQAPNSGLLREFGIRTFGINELGLRFASVFMGALSVGAFYLVMRGWTQKILLSLLAAGLLALNFWMQLYAVEARPYVISIFFELIFLFFLIDHLRTPREAKINLSLLATAFMWLCSISMQPLAFVGCGFGFFVILFFVTKDQRYRSASLSLFAALFLFMPLSAYIVSQSTQYLTTKLPTISELAQRTLNDLNTLSLVVGRKTNWEWPGIILLTFGGAASLLKRRTAPWFLQLIVLTTVTALLLLVAFEFKIQWFLSPRYFIFLVPISLLIISYSLFLSLEKLSRVTVYGILAVLLILSALPETHPEVYRKHGTAWRQLYAHLDLRTEDKSVAYFYSHHRPGEWDAGLFQATNWYSPQRVKPLPDFDNNWPRLSASDHMKEHLNSGWEPERIFLVHFRKASRLHWQELLSSRYKVFTLNDFEIVEIENKEGLEKSLLAFFTDLGSRLEPTPEAIKVYETVVTLGLHSKDCALVSKNLDIFIHLKDGFEPFYRKKATAYQDKYRALCGSKKSTF
jgi:hypothetical protein